MTYLDDAARTLFKKGKRIAVFDTHFVGAGGLDLLVCDSRKEKRGIMAASALLEVVRGGWL